MSVSPSRRRLLRLPALFLTLSLALTPGTSLALGRPLVSAAAAPSPVDMVSPLTRWRWSAQSLPYFREGTLERCLALVREQPELSPEEAVTYVNMGLDQEFYTQIETISDPADTAVLVNKYRALPADYVPELVGLESPYGSGSLTPEAAQAFAQMADAAREDGLSLRCVSGYRSYSYQDSLYRRNLSQYAQSLVDTFSARPGHSEHQTGLSLDINVARTSAHFENTEEFAWLQDNCARFGFILRYPQDKSAVTGYRFEPWHYRYVGGDIAQACTGQGLTLEEYMARLPAPAL